MRGGLLVRLASLFVGLFLFAVGIVAQLESGLGLPPWDVLHQGLDENLPISFGVANIAVGVVVLALAAVLGARVGFGTLANATAVGVFIELLLRAEPVQALAEWPLAARLALVVVGVLATGDEVG